jgi:hypothetical protein
MIVLRFLDAVSQGIGIRWIIAVLKAAIVYVGRVTEVAFLTACRTARVRHLGSLPIEDQQPLKYGRCQKDRHKDQDYGAGVMKQQVIEADVRFHRFPTSMIARVQSARDSVIRFHSVGLWFPQLQRQYGMARRRSVSDLPGRGWGGSGPPAYDDCHL